jgi:DNA modification methylase
MEENRRIINEYHIWDARKLSELLSAGDSIDVVITSPPYWNLKDYGVDIQIGSGQTYDQYLDDLERVFRDIHRFTRRRGSLWIISDTIKHRGEIKLLPFDLAKKLKDIGWILQDIIIWNKDRTLPWSHQGKLRNIFEYITLYSKNRKFNYYLDRTRETSELEDWWVRYPERYNPRGKAPSRAWHFPIPRQGSWGNNWVRHFNPLPPELAERILLLTTNKNDLVLDPFAGSGTVLAQAYAMGRRYIGLDLNRGYQEMFKTKVLPFLCNFYEQKKEEMRKREEAKETFSELIMSLRKMKYPKQLMRLYEKKHGSVKYDAALALGGRKADFLNITFLFPIDAKISPDFLLQMKELTLRPPLSKYGIETTLDRCFSNIISLEWLETRNVDFQDNLYLYSGGKTYAWTEKFSIVKFLDFVRNDEFSEFYRLKHPPIFSNIEVKINPKAPTLSMSTAD